MPALTQPHRSGLVYANAPRTRFPRIPKDPVRCFCSWPLPVTMEQVDLRIALNSKHSMEQLHQKHQDGHNVKSAGSKPY